MGQQRACGLPAIQRPHWPVAVILAVDDQIARPLPAEPQTEYGREQEELPRTLRPERRITGRPCNSRQVAITSLVPRRSHIIGVTNRLMMLTEEMMVSMKAAVPRLMSRSTARGTTLNHDDAVTSATQSMYAREVPEGLGAPHMLIEHLQPDTLDGLQGPLTGSVSRHPSIGLQAHVFGHVSEGYRQQQQRAAKHCTYQQKGVLPTQVCYHEGQQRGEHGGADAEAAHSTPVPFPSVG